MPGWGHWAMPTENELIDQETEEGEFLELADLVQPLDGHLHEELHDIDVNTKITLFVGSNEIIPPILVEDIAAPHAILEDMAAPMMENAMYEEFQSLYIPEPEEDALQGKRKIRTPLVDFEVDEKAIGEDVDLKKKAKKGAKQPTWKD
ncbi:hypothetical protein ZWY2020_025405 [Hordeum vulgare]|nr:hypothetical protein ZWY2020_025405 [Hordeum vulgare]